MSSRLQVHVHFVTDDVECSFNRARQVDLVITKSSQCTVDIKLNRPGVVRLLVSVRSRAEAVAAIKGGAEILDVKEPSLGSLGMAQIDQIQEIADYVSGQCNGPTTQVPLSVALGELRDWFDRKMVPVLPAAVTFAKLGLSGLAHDSDWQRTWQQIRGEFDRQRDTPLRWVAVAYADEMAAQSPPLKSILLAAGDGCAGLLVDTYTKTGKSLIDFASVSVLTEIARQCRESGLFLAIAGSLTIDAALQLGDVGADIFAIRSAACPRANRRDSIDPTLVTAFREALVNSQRSSIH